MIKGRKCKLAAAKFVVKISNRFDVLKEDGEDTLNSSKVINGYFEQNSSFRRLIKPSKSSGEGLDRSTNEGKFKASKPAKKSTDNCIIQSPKSEDCVEINKYKVRI